MDRLIGWCGPLIDLSSAASHVGDYVQLLVVVRQSRLVQRHKSSNKGALPKTVVQIGDDTRAFLSVSVWHKHVSSAIATGDIVLLQNVQIVKFRDILEAATVQLSSLVILIRSNEVTSSKISDKLIAHSRFGSSTREKLKKVMEWVQQTESVRHGIQSIPNNEKRLACKNWKVPEKSKLRTCISISEASQLTESCNVEIYACSGEIILPFASRMNEEFVEKKLFVRKILSGEKQKIVKELICTGCKLCGFPLNSGFLQQHNPIPLYCLKSSNYQHDICLIYRPFLLYVWDESAQIPLLVKNKSAEALFGNITADNVYNSFLQRNNGQVPDSTNDHKADGSHLKYAGISRAPHVRLLDEDGNHQQHDSLIADDVKYVRQPDFYIIWFILLKLLLEQGKNSPYSFEITVNCENDLGNGRFELVSFALPCYESDKL
ncbi:hypothetical protein QJS10_CPB12g01683 [Acorus calamus]|uniref:Uncharacterized protein n=1 Tax=Acorus calamus TaxID=4465 RepID=A0AAV9DPF9_ACOCL|nr:hypothetical protein QJS10_CPB12g01683 [Acorus calamus]